MSTIYLSSLESKCIMPSDLTACDNEAKGFHKMQRNTLQITDEEDHLKKGDILYSINGQLLSDKNCFELISLLGSLSGVSEICVLRKTDTNYCCIGGLDDETVPYHNGIFAQNSIKLAIRRYDKPAIKSGSEVDMTLSSQNMHNSDAAVVFQSPPLPFDEQQISEIEPIMSPPGN